MRHSTERDAWLHEWIPPGHPVRSTETSRPMVASEVIELAGRPGHAIGAHTVNHLFLPRQSHGTCLSELRDAKVTLEELLERPVESIVYPFGAVSIDVANRRRSQGLAMA